MDRWTKLKKELRRRTDPDRWTDKTKDGPEKREAYEEILKLMEYIETERTAEQDEAIVAAWQVLKQNAGIAHASNMRIESARAARSGRNLSANQRDKLEVRLAKRIAWRDAFLAVREQVWAWRATEGGFILEPCCKFIEAQYAIVKEREGDAWRQDWNR